MDKGEKMENQRELRTITIRDFRIKSKKDWVVFWVMAVWVDYGFAARFFEKRVAAWIINLGGLEIDGMKVAWYYGRLVAGVVLMGIVVEIVCFLCHKSAKVKLAAAVTTLLLSLVLAGLCQTHIHMMFQYAKPFSMYMNFWNNWNIC